MSVTRLEDSCAGPSPIKEVLAELERIDPHWRIKTGDPGDLTGWIRGSDFMRGTEGPFLSLLERMARRLRTNDKRTVAASFALRFGWCASAAIGPYLLCQCIPDVSLENICLKFRDDTLFEKMAILSPRGVMLRGLSSVPHPLVRYETDPRALLHSLRTQLERQASPVVEALFAWSGFSRKGSWGMITSSWASQFINICGRLCDQPSAMPILRDFFSGDDEVGKMKPQLNLVSLRGVTHVYRRRASCCRYYLLPQGDLCASYPLVSDEERLKRNLEWMEQQLR